MNHVEIPFTQSNAKPLILVITTRQCLPQYLSELFLGFALDSCP